jgi:MFS family permease
MDQTPSSPFLRASAGAAALALAMGVGRFAYTALLPSLQVGLGFDAAAGGAIASANLVGYLVGALWARRTPRGGPRQWLVRVGLVLSVLTTGLVVACTGVGAWSALRFLGGVASGLVFVLVSASVLEALPPGAEAYAGILYSGVGSGIALSGAVAALLPTLPWQTPWIVLAAMSAVLAVPVLVQRPPSAPPVAPVRTVTSDRLSLRRLTAAYFLEGLGYIVSGTFAVTAVQHTPGLTGWAPWVWVAAGIAAAPSAVIWSRAARRVGARRALIMAYAAQAVGMALPALSRSATAAIAGALLFGGTFMGIVTVLLDHARRMDPSSASRTIGTLTVVYGIGQALGPILAGWLTRAVGDPAPAALAAAAAVGLGALLLAAP